MPSLVPRSLLASLVVCLCAGMSSAGDLASNIRQRHPWGRFEPGAWKLVRVVTETLDAYGAVTSTTTSETKTTLKEVDDGGVTLLVEVVVEIGGRRLDAEPQTIRQGFHGEVAGQDVKIRDAGPAKVVVEGREYPCRIEQVESINGKTKTVTRTFYSSTTPPYSLKLDSTVTDVQTGAVLSQTEWQVCSLDIPSRVLKAIKNAAHVKSVCRHPKGNTTTLAVTSSDVPGGIVCHNARELDANGRLLRRSTLELVAYGLEPEEGRRGFLRRWRSPHRHRIPLSRPSPH